jgi:hypothetical protein
VGLLDRFFPRITGRAFGPKTVKQKFVVEVPAAHATAVQSALEAWATSKGWQRAKLQAEPEGDQVRLSLEHDEWLDGEPSTSAGDTVTGELERLVEDAMREEPG